MATEAVVVTGIIPDDATGTTADWTATGFGTGTVAVIIANNSNVTSTTALDGSLSLGGRVGTDDFSVMGFSEDRSSSTNTSRYQDNTRSIQLIGDSANVTRADATFITNGIQITTQSNGPTLEDDSYGMALLLKGTTNVAMFRTSLGTGTSAINVETPGFQPDLVFAFTVGLGTQSNAAHNLLSFGVAHNGTGGLVQGCQHFGSRDGQGAGDIYHELRDGEIAASMDVVGGVAWTATLSAFDSLGFSVTPSVSAGNDEILFIAVELADQDDAWVGVLTSETDTGTQAYTGTGFTPDVVGIVGSTQTVVDTVTQTGGMFIGLADGTRERCLSFADEDSPAVAVCSSTMSTGIVDCKFDDGTADAAATLSSMDSDGFTLNYSNGSASARKWLAFAIGDSTAGGAGVGIPIAAYHHFHHNMSQT